MTLYSKNTQRLMDAAYNKAIDDAIALFNKTLLDGGTLLAAMMFTDECRKLKK